MDTYAKLCQTSKKKLNQRKTKFCCVSKNIQENIILMVQIDSIDKILKVIKIIN